jgi:hypothetical protein
MNVGQPVFVAFYKILGSRFHNHLLETDDEQETFTSNYISSSTECSTAGLPNIEG